MTNTGVRADFFPSAQRVFPISNLNPFPFRPKETKIREENFYKMQTKCLLLSLYFRLGKVI